MNSFIAQAQSYTAHQKNSKTPQAHWISVPLITFSLMILLGFVQLVIPGVFQTSLACLATLVLLIYYARLNWVLTLALAPILVLMLWVAYLFSYNGPTTLGFWAFIVTLISGITLQLYGYYSAEEKPALRVQLSQLQIAPLYLMAELFFRAGWMSSLKEEIHGALPKTNE